MFGMCPKAMVPMIMASLLCLAGCGVVINTAPGNSSSSASSPQSPRRAQPPSNQSQAASAPANGSFSTTVTLAVRIIPTSGPGAQSRYPYPAELTITVPRAYASSLEAIGAAGFVIVAPKGWQGTAEEYQDGSRRVILFPPNGSPQPGGPRIVVQTDGGCLGCAWTSAAPYFAWVREHAKQAGFPFILRDLKPVATYHQSPVLHDYAFISSRTGLHVNGVAYAPFITNPHGYVFFREAQTIFPAGEHPLATIILNNLEAQFLQPNASA
jgi:hypothetical protein